MAIAVAVQEADKRAVRMAMAVGCSYRADTLGVPSLDASNLEVVGRQNVEVERSS